MDNKTILESNPLLILYEEIAQVKSLLQELLASNKKQDIEIQERLLSSDECRSLFYPPISKSTLYRWTRDALISKYRIAGKVVYKKSEIESATKTLKTYKHKKASIEMEAA
jgi:hypothetical protein